MIKKKTINDQSSKQEGKRKQQPTKGTTIKLWGKTRIVQVGGSTGNSQTMQHCHCCLTMLHALITALFLVFCKQLSCQCQPRCTCFQTPIPTCFWMTIPTCFWNMPIWLSSLNLFVPHKGHFALMCIWQCHHCNPGYFIFFNFSCRAKILPPLWLPRPQHNFDGQHHAQVQCCHQCHDIMQNATIMLWHDEKCCQQYSNNLQHHAQCHGMKKNATAWHTMLINAAEWRKAPQQYGHWMLWHAK